MIIRKGNHSVSIASYCGTKAISADPDQTSQGVTSGLGPCCLRYDFLIRLNRNGDDLCHVIRREQRLSKTTYHRITIHVY